MYSCASVEGVATDLQWVWLLLNEGARHLSGWKMLEVTDQDVVTNHFGGLFVQIPLYTKAY
jgi:hypothetical protein